MWSAMLNLVWSQVQLQKRCEVKMCHHKCLLSTQSARNVQMSAQGNTLTEQQRIQSIPFWLCLCLCRWHRLPCSCLPTAATQQSHSSTPPSLLILSPLLTAQMFSASFTKSSLCLLAWSTTWGSLHWMRWSCLKACQPFALMKSSTT